MNTRLSWSIRLRWFAAGGYFIATFIAKNTVDLNLPYDRIWIVLAILTAINLIYYTILKVVKDFSFNTELLFLSVHIIIDLILLTLLLHFSGGIENPIFFFYLFHVVMSSIVFPGWIPFLIATFIIWLFAGLILLEYTHIAYHYCIYNGTMHDNQVYLVLVFVIFTITVYVSTYICTTFMKMFRSIKRKIDEQNLQLIKADEQKTAFYRFTSHELKSPIIAIKTSIDGVLKNSGNNLDSRSQNILERASARSDQMLNIIKELLVLSQKRSVFKEIQHELINFAEILNDIVGQEQEQASSKNIQINTDLSCPNLTFHADKEDIKKIFSNLINNSIRYTDEGGSINISCMKKHSKIVILIQDSGIGIPKKDLKKIFQEFYRAENAKKIVQFGTGLGLSLVKQIVENYGGKIKVKSEEYKGSTFQVEFPV